MSLPSIISTVQGKSVRRMRHSSKTAMRHLVSVSRTASDAVPQQCGLRKKQSAQITSDTKPMRIPLCCGNLLFLWGSHALKVGGTQDTTQPICLGAKEESTCETTSQPDLPYSPISILLRQGGDTENERAQATWYSTNRRCSAPKGISRTPLECGNAIAARQKNSLSKRQVRPVCRRVYGLQRHCARPYQSAGNGRCLERRSP